MADEAWTTMPFDKAVQVNPPVPLQRGTVYPFVDMKTVDPSSRGVGPSEAREYKGGGSRFTVGDTLMARITPCLENGKIARYVPGVDQQSAHGSTEFIVIRGRPDVTDNDFAYYLTKWDGIRSYFISQMTGSSGRQRVPTGALSHYEVTIPPVKEQQAIAHILGTLDDKIELNRRMNHTLEGMARAIFKSWFVDFDPVRAKAAGQQPPGLAPHIADLFPDAFETSELGEIPRGWEVKSLDKIAGYLNGLACQKYPPEKGEESLPVIKIRELRQGLTASTDQATANVPDGYIVEDGDVLFSWSGSLLVDVWTHGRGVLNQHLFKVTSDTYPKWFFYYWTDHRLSGFQRIAAYKATTMGHIKRHHLSDARVCIPDNKVMQIADEQIGPLLDRRIRDRLESRTLAALRDTLLPKLISGELRVPDAERIVGRRA